MSLALRESWSALWRSRLLVWGAACLVVLVLGVKVPVRQMFDPTGFSSSLGGVGNLLAAPAVRWDATWYLGIAHGGYTWFAQTGFFPLYPLLVHVVGWVTFSPVIAGVLISLLATFAGLVIVYRLTELELGALVARRAVLLTAFAPFAVYLSAVYTEGLFLMLSAGTLYAARRGRWALAGVIGGLAALSRVTGVLLIAPVLVLFVLGPWEDQRPRWRQLAWALLIPAGLLAFCAYTASKGFGFDAPFDSQRIVGGHHFTGPISGIWHGLSAAWHQLGQLLSGDRSVAARGPQMLQVAVLAVALVGLVQVWRRLPAAYGVYVLLGLLMPLSSPSVGEPLRGLERYVSLMFPLFMAAGAWSCERRWRRALVWVFALLLVGFTAQFATWRYVGTMPF